MLNWWSGFANVSLASPSLIQCHSQLVRRGKGSECLHVLMHLWVAKPKCTLSHFLHWPELSHSAIHNHKEGRAWNMPSAGWPCALLKSSKWIYYQRHCLWREQEENIHGKFFLKKNEIIIWMFQNRADYFIHALAFNAHAFHETWLCSFTFTMKAGASFYFYFLILPAPTIVSDM